MENSKRKLDKKSSASMILAVLVCFVMITVYMISNNLTTSYALPSELDAKDIDSITTKLETIAIPGNTIVPNGINMQSKFRGTFIKDGKTYTVDMFCLESEKGMPNNAQYDKVVDSSAYIDEGIAYIVNSAYKDSKFDNNNNLALSNDQYYIIQSAIWIYQEIKNPKNDTIANMWKSIQENHTSGAAKTIYELVYLAQKVQSSTGENQIEITNNNPEFKLSDDKTYYESSPITVSIKRKNDNTTFSGFTFEINNNSYDTIVVDENGTVITDLNSLENKTFKIRVNATNLNAGTEANITGKISGIFTTNSFLAYKKQTDADKYQVALLVTNNKANDYVELKAKISVPDTGADYSKYIYIIGAMVLVIGLSVIYVNAKAKQQ